MIKKIKYNQDYICEADYADSVFVEFTKEDSNTYMNITTVQTEDSNTYTKRYLLSKEEDLDEEDLRNVNEFLQDQDIRVVMVEEEEEEVTWI